MRVGPGTALVVAVSLTLAGCASTHLQGDPDKTPVVPLADVIGSMKCGLAYAISEDRDYRSGLVGGVAKVELDVNVVLGRTLKGGLSAGIPIATGATVTPGFTFSNDKQITTNSTVKFNFDMSEADPSICDTNIARGRDAGFSGWMASIVQDLSMAAAGPPKVSMQSYAYDSNFTITAKGGGSLDFEIVPVKGNLSYDSSRQDIQHIVVTIDAVHIVGGRIVRGKPVVKPGAKPFNQIPDTPDPRVQPKPPRERVKVCGGTAKPGAKPFFNTAACE
ncbi:hypothetical protein MesoLj131c_14950 [Mesorhizobium sp. 131-3-5]|uniref:hypothetical protein n=1 Tax=Mesorhizobium sp. 131-3-5 TaxID=2744520 RepID=UPI001926738A|nr:hypothetical protein [Mesorhizobium sp. 131-3-5]BCH07237.1 hypothetical protein MesoLj131c_14950 [Mesorhizobium sp. 131-3-5]